MIPKQLHFVWTGPDMPDWARKNLQLFRDLNPEFTFHIHDETDLLCCFEYAYSRIKGKHILSRRSDLIRLSVLLRHGGWYFDCDFLPIRPLSELYDRYKGFSRDCFVTHGSYLGKRPWIANGIIGTAANSTFLALAVAQILRVSEFSRLIEWESYSTRVFTEMSEQHPDAVHIGELNDFYRPWDPKRSMAAYARIRDAGYTTEAMVKELGNPLPYAFHQGMQDSLLLPETNTEACCDP